MQVPSAESTGAFDVFWDVPTASFVPGGSLPRSGFDEELRRLLRSRLIFVHLLALAFTILLAVLSRLTATDKQDAVVRFGEGYWWGLLGRATGRGAGRNPRLVAIVGDVASVAAPVGMMFFATYAATSGLNRFEALAAPLEDAARSVPALAVGLSGLTSLQGFVLLILAYGVLIPNTRRRSLLVVAALAAVPLAIIPAAAAANPMLREGLVPCAGHAVRAES